MIEMNLIDAMINYLKLNKKTNNEINITDDFHNEPIYVDQVDYYYSNVIARSSKTMSECRHLKINLKSTGTEG